MNQTLVITEKPSVAQSIAKVIGAINKRTGYLEGNGYLVSWCVGHLIELADPQTYDEKYTKWRYEDLPIIPSDWKYQVKTSTENQYTILTQLMFREDVKGLINACDAGREGELIFRTVYDLAVCTKPVKRLWISSMEDTVIKNGFQTLRKGVDYNGLHLSALCRAKADWLVGINGTRLYSVCHHKTLNIGRVMTPTLAMVVSREEEIANFSSEPFYHVMLELDGFEAQGERLPEETLATTQLKSCQELPLATVSSVKTVEKREKPPLLYDLTTLQRDANRLLGFTAQQTLDYLQGLYEKKLCTYPRTDSRYITSDMETQIPSLVKTIRQTFPAYNIGAKDPHTKQIVNDQKVSDHTAILITPNVMKMNLEVLLSGEEAILEMVAARLLLAIGTPYIYQETRLTLTCQTHEFITKGMVNQQEGFKEVEKLVMARFKATEEVMKEEKANILPSATEGMTLPIKQVYIKQGKTTPPKHYTEDTLLAAMESAGAKEMPEEAERKGIGTPATRAGILEKLVKVGFLERKKNQKRVVLLPSEHGTTLIHLVPEKVKSASLTADWEYQLHQVEKGQLSSEAFLNGIEEMVTALTRNISPSQIGQSSFASDLKPIGLCPRCGSPVYEKAKGFFCGKKDCGFSLWKNNKFFAAKKKELTKTIVTKLLTEGKVKLTKCYSEKTGKPYDAMVILEDSMGPNVTFRMEFLNN